MEASKSPWFPTWEGGGPRKIWKIWKICWGPACVPEFPVRRPSEGGAHSMGGGGLVGTNTKFEYLVSGLRISGVWFDVSRRRATCLNSVGTGAKIASIGGRGAPLSQELGWWEGGPITSGLLDDMHMNMPWVEHTVGVSASCHSLIAC
jgi:hypothetical protein